MIPMLDNTRENISPARVLADISYFTAKIEEEENRTDFLVHVIVFHDDTRQTNFIFFAEPDQFLRSVENAMETGWRPIAVEAVEDEDQDYVNIALEYLFEPSIEDECIIESMYDSKLIFQN